MPELPEVETIKRGLQKHLIGYTIQNTIVKLPRIVYGDVNHVLGATVQEVRRFGKGLVIDLDNQFSIAVHVKMTGQLVFHPQPSIANHKIFPYPNQWTHVIFQLSKQAFLYYADVRQFGWLHILKTEAVKNLAFFKTLGPEPLKDLNLELFSQITSKSSTSIKALLMNQQKIAGIGNIYANDALFLAGIHPGRKASSLPQNEITKLFNALERILQKSIEIGGASEVNFVNALGEKGEYQKQFLIYKREGKPCINCTTIISRITINNRGTFVCVNCQK